LPEQSLHGFTALATAERSVHPLVPVKSDERLTHASCRVLQSPGRRQITEQQPEVERVHALVGVPVPSGVRLRLATAPRHARRTKQCPLHALTVTGEAVGILGQEGYTPGSRSRKCRPSLTGPFDF